MTQKKLERPRASKRYQVFRWLVSASALEWGVGFHDNNPIALCWSESAARRICRALNRRQET